MPDTQDLQPVLDAAQNQLGLTVSTGDSLDTKALGILGFNAALLIFTLQSEMGSRWWLLALVFMALALSTLFTLIIIWPTAKHNNYAGALVDLRRHPEYLQQSTDELVLQLIADTQEAINVNDRKNARKFALCTYSIVLTLAGVLALVGCILKV